MKFIKFEVKNFGSYKYLELDLDNQGLSLIYGRTGSGKSTIPDIVCWILFGVTAKDGNADEVRSWHSPDEATDGTLILEQEGAKVAVRRIRGKPGQNDLYWMEEQTGKEKRGKDLVETQKLLNRFLNVSAETYLTGAYFSEFSQTAQFFLAKAKDRRSLFEKIAPLELPTQLAERASEERKAVKKLFEEAERDYAKVLGKREQLEASLESADAYSLNWLVEHNALVSELMVRSNNFDLERESKLQVIETKRKLFEERREATLAALSEARLVKLDTLIQLKENKDLTAECPTCKQPSKSATKVLIRQAALESEIADLYDKIDDCKRASNPHDDADVPIENPYVAQIAREKSKINPFLAQIDKLASDLEKALKLSESLEDKVKDLEHKTISLTQLYDLSADLRGALLHKAVQEIETSTNRLLDSYFDAEIKVNFSLSGDSLNVDIQKSGYECSYKQLSKGQRGLLKLCFSVSVMEAVSNKAGVHFNSLWFDEALDGLDTDLKVKAFSLFQELETKHESIFLIDHAPEFQTLFDNRYHVTMESDTSEVERE